MYRSFIILLQSLGIGMVLTLGTFIIGLQVGWIEKMDWLQAGAVLTGYSSVYMCVFQSRWNYPMGVITTFLYSWFYWTADVPAPALAIFNLYMVFSLMFGYWRWGPDGKPIPVTSLPMTWVPAYVGYGVFIGALLWIAVQFGAVISPLESAIVIGSGVAQLLLDNKRIETWYVWMVVNIASIYFYWDATWYLVMFQYVFLLANVFWGYRQWKLDPAGTKGGVFA